MKSVWGIFMKIGKLIRPDFPDEFGICSTAIDSMVRDQLSSNIHSNIQIEKELRYRIDRILNMKLYDVGVNNFQSIRYNLRGLKEETLINKMVAFVRNVFKLS